MRDKFINSAEIWYPSQFWEICSDDATEPIVKKRCLRLKCSDKIPWCCKIILNSIAALAPGCINPRTGIGSDSFRKGNVVA